MKEKVSFKGGLELRFLENAEFETITNKPTTEQYAIIGRNALRLLMMGWPASSFAQLKTWPIFEAVFIQRNPLLLKEFRLAFQNGLEHVFTQLKGQHFTPEQNEQVQLYLSNCMTFLPYTDLTPYESIKIPQNIDGEWEMVEYTVTPIELTDKNRQTAEKDRVFAYGLEPLLHKKAQSHLIFMGTTYPAGQGFFPQIYTDLEAFETAGNALYLNGRARIQAWLQKQKDKVHVCGVSLGGALSLLLAMDCGERLSRVDALNPPGLYDSSKKSSYDYWDECPSKPEVVVQMQADDPVSKFGVWKTDWDILRVTPPKEKRGPISFCDHFLNYASFADTEFSYVSAQEENLKRTWRNLLLYTIARGMVYYLVLVPYNYLIRPALYFIANHHLALSLLATALSATVCLLALLTVSLIPAAALIAAVLVLGVSGGNVLSSTVFNHFAPPETVQLPPHHPLLPRNAAMDLYNEQNLVEAPFTPEEEETYQQITELFAPEEAKPGTAKTRAEVVLIKRSLGLFATKQGGELHEALAKERQEYKAGLNI